ncbi:MAG: phosphoribosylanthranilate isomerase, partial [Proteobacteria bacterium]|nr:phosphoribosylanthranilate isomerase [Pseudomonadota bacterium]
MIRVKVCGITNSNDALLASEMGAYALGFIFFQGSKRYIEPKKAKEIIAKLPPFIVKVGVFVSEPVENVLKIIEVCGLDRVQVIDDDFKKYKKIRSDKIIRTIRVKDLKDIERANKSIYFPLLDTHSAGAYGGTGETFDWNLLT